MKKNFLKATFIIVIGLFAFSLAAETTDGDDIFKNQEIEADDFYSISVEPSQKDIKDKMNSQMEKIKAQQLKIIRDREEKQKQLEETKASTAKKIQDAQKKFQEEIEKKRAAMMGKKEKVSPKISPVQDKKKPEIQSNRQATKIEEKVTEIHPEQQEEKPISQTPVDDRSSNVAEKEMNETISERQKFVDTAMELKGIPYLWGGKTPRPGLDCSGLVTYAAKKSLGVDLSGNAQMIYNKVKPISIDNAIPGDLVFFKGQSDSRITHIGIFLGQNTEGNDFGNQSLFLNAASAGPRTGVIISGLNEKYWKKNYYGAGRFLEGIE